MIVSRIETNPDFEDWRALEGLLRAAYAPMEGRIDPPSFLTQMTVSDIARKARSEDLYLAREGQHPVACGFGIAREGVYEIGKIAVAAAYRRQGYARAVLNAAAVRARQLGLPALQLYARVELVENHATYIKLGFQQHGLFTHHGFAHPTAIIFRRAL